MVLTTANTLRVLPRSPLTSRVQENCLLITMPDSAYFNGVATFGDKIVLVGTYGDGRTVQEYDITKNRFKKMGPLPFSKMTMIKWADNFLMIGGLGSKSVLSKVV